MQRIFSLRENINTFIDRRNQVLRILLKFFLMLITIGSLGRIFGASDVLAGKHIALIAAIACAFIPFAYSYLLFILFCLFYLSIYSVDVILLFLIAVLTFYGVYSRNFSKYGYLALVTFILLPTPLSGIVPLYVGINCGLLAIPPMLAGIVIYYFLTSISGALKMWEIAATGTQLYQCVLDTMVENRELIICLVVMSVTAVLAGQISRMRITYSWYASIPIAAIVNAVLYLYGCFFFELSSNISDVIVTMILSVLVMMLLQFFRGVIDYSRIEDLQFEDDEYFYYVRAVPKVKVVEEKVQVQTIAKQQNRRRPFRDRNRE